MSIVDLSEIPGSTGDEPDPDQFELFARDFLRALNFRILEGPGRGADGGRDMLVEEALTGRIFSASRKWLVSAKHFAHSGRSVGDRDEPDPIGRVRKFRASGFLAFYSTIPSSGLDRTLSQIRSEIEVEVLDRGVIATQLVSNPELRNVFKLYLPTSFSTWCHNCRPVADLFREPASLTCRRCGRDVLLAEDAIVVEAYRCPGPGYYRRVISDVYCACKGECDQALEKAAGDVLTSWEEISDLRIPLVFLRWVAATLSRMQRGDDVYTNDAHYRHMELVLSIAQTVVRDPSIEQKERLEELLGAPSLFGCLPDRCDEDA